MELDHHAAAQIAQNYFEADRPLLRLGWGISGFVYLSPDTRTAVKVHRYDESFERELKVYRHLQKLNIIEVLGLAIPQLREARRDLKLLRMDCVSAPYLLDFAGASFDPPDFSPETVEQWHADIAEKFGPNAHIAHAVYAELAKQNIYYLDFRPSNMNVAGLPGVVSYEPSGEDSGLY
jgi:hypothetical protein